MRVATIVLILLAGCGGGTPDPAGSPPARDARTPRAVLTEFAIALDPPEAPAGEVSIEAENAGTIPHELVIVRTDSAPDALPLEGAVVPEEEVTMAADSGLIERGSTRTVTAELEPGAYVLICNVAGHYQAGMRASFTVRG